MNSLPCTQKGCTVFLWQGFLLFTHLRRWALGCKLLAVSELKVEMCGCRVCGKQGTCILYLAPDSSGGQTQHSLQQGACSSTVRAELQWK